MTTWKSFGRKVVVGSAISMMALGSMFGAAYAEGDDNGDSPAPPGPVPNPPSLENPPSTPVPLPGGGG